MITAKIIADSLSPDNVRLVTMQLEYPRFIHSEVMTHRVFSRNASSSRAIPVAKMIEAVRANPAMPIHWGKNQPGMQADGQLIDELLDRAKDRWMQAANAAADIAESMNELGLHKQVANRILEPFQHMNVVVTATEWDNFFELRAHPDAQPEIHELALQMRKAMDTSIPMSLRYGEWHLPYVNRYRGEESGNSVIFYGDKGELSVADAIMVSASCCAQVSYRKLDDSLEKARDIYERLIESKPAHASPFEHQATPSVGRLHYGLNGNFNGWIQNRKLIESNFINSK